MDKLKRELIARLERIPGIRHIPYPDRDDGFSGLVFQAGKSATSTISTNSTCGSARR